MNGAEFNEGDLVEAVGGETVIRGRLKVSEITSRLVVPCVTFDMPIEVLEREGFTLTVIEKAKPKLPEDPGIYADQHGGMWTLHKNGEWINNGDGSVAVSFDADDMSGIYRSLLPFTKLEPAAETARRILDRIRSDNTGDGGYYDHRYTGKQLRALFAEFGVES